MTTNDLVNAHALLTVLEQPHQGGHHCPATNTPTARGSWVPFRDTCEPRATIANLRAIIGRLGEQVHAAAHDDKAVDVVASAMLAGTPLGELSPEVAEGWRQMARLAIEGLAGHLEKQGAADDYSQFSVRPVRYGHDTNAGAYTETCAPADAQAYAVYRLDTEGHEQWVSDHPTRDEAVHAVLVLTQQ